MQEKEQKIDIHGSCVSFNVIKKQTQDGENWKLDGVKNGLYFSHVNIAGSMGQPIDPLPEIEDIAFNSHFKRNLITDLKKDVIGNLEQSDAEWLLIDFYDMARAQWAYRGGSFTHTFNLRQTAPEYYSRIQDQMEGYFRWIDLPSFLWYPKVDAYMERMIEKYGRDHIILNRVYYNQYYVDQNHEMREVGGMSDFYGGYADNQKVRALEGYVIDKWKIRSMDVAKYFVADIQFGGDVLSVHYEREYYRLAGRILKAIIDGQEEIVTDHIDLEALEYKMYRCAEVGAGDSQGYLQCAHTPLDYFEPLDELLNSLSEDQIIKCRGTILQVYRHVECNRHKYMDAQKSIDQIQEELLSLFESML